MGTILLLLTDNVSASSTFGGYTFYIGDPHAHSGVSEDGWSSDLGEGCGSHVKCGAFADLYETAEANGLDWLGMSEHVNGPGYMAQDENWYDLKEMTLGYDDDGAGSLLVIPAAEVWFDMGGSPLGHKNLLFFGTDEELEALTKEEASVTGGEQTRITACSDITTWADELSGNYGPIVLLPHHPAADAPMPTDYSCHTDGYELGVEVYSHFGNSLGGHLSYDPLLGPINTEGYVHNALDPEGYAQKLGFVGGSDFHGSTPGSLCTEGTARHYNGGGFTVAWLPEDEPLTRSSLYDAFVARHTYATTGPLVPVTMVWSAVGIEAYSGDELSIRGGLTLTATVTIADEALSSITAVYLETPDAALTMTDNGDGTWTYEMAADATLPAWAYAAIQIDGPTWFEDDWCDDGGADTMDWVWMSPTWFEVVDHDDDEDGVSWLEGDCDDADASAYPDAVELWYDGVDNDCLGGDDFDQDADGVVHPTDCDDTDATIHPGAEDTWYDGVDSDCGGEDDLDRDADGADFAIDCDDDDPTRSPLYTEIWYDGLDADCGGEEDYDQDGDGHLGIPFGDDCNDRRPTIHPSAFDRWYDGIDADCTRNDDYDRDGDGHRPFAFRGDDCDDGDATIYTGASDAWYDGKDSNCDRNDDFDQDADGARIRPYGGDPDDADPMVTRDPWRPRR